MKINKYTFREIDRKWILIDSDKDIKRINKNNNLNLSLDPVLGIIYIDHEMGLTLRILGNVYKDRNGYSFNEEFINEKVINVRLDKKKKFDITILNEKVINGIDNTPAIEKQVDVFYAKKAIVESRKMECLDIFRHKFFPDDIELYNIKDKDEEIIWGRIIDCSLNNNLVVCKLLDNSIIEKKYKANSLVIAKYEKNKKEEYVIIKDIVKKIEKNAE